MKSRKVKKLLATLTAVVMLIGLMPTVVLAAPIDDDITALTIQGVNVFALPGFAGAGQDSVAEARTNTLTVYFTQEQLDNDSAAASITVHGDGDEQQTVRLIAGGDDSDVVALATARSEGINIIAATTLSVGDVIWVTSGHASTGALMYRILVALYDPSAPGGPTVATQGGAISGVGAVVNVPLNVVVPTNLNFALDPLQFTGGSAQLSQVQSVDYRMANRSAVPVLVGFDLTATAAAGVALVDSPNALDHGLNVTARAAHFGMIGATSVTSGPPTFADPSEGTMVYNRATDGTQVFFGPAAATGATTSDARIEFLLGAATGEPPATLAASNRGVASFQFYAELNTYATWAANDISVAGNFTLTGINAAHYGDPTATGADREGMMVHQTVGLNVFPMGPVADVIVTATTGAVSANVTTWTQGNPLTILFDRDVPPATLTIAGTTDWPQNRPTVGLGPDWSYDATTGLLTIYRTFGLLPNTLTITGGGVTLTLNITAATP